MPDLIALAQRLAGQNAFEKGTALFNNKQVQNLSFTAHGVDAQVQGTQLYQVSLRKVSDSFDGGCSCPASEGFDFCKHCVAAVLAYAEELSKFEKMRDGPPAARVRAHIEQLSDEQTKDALFKIIAESPELLEHWLLVADVSSSRLLPKDIKRRFVKALPLRDVWRHDKVRQYFDNAFRALSSLFEVIEILNAEYRFELCEFALQRYDKILERIDDSGGYRTSVFALLEKQLAKSFIALDWKEEDKASYMISLYDAAYNHLSFSSIPERFIEQNNTHARAVFFDALKRAVDKRSNPERKVKKSESLVFTQMTKQLITHYESSGQLKPALYYFTQIASSMDDYFSIIKLATDAQELVLAKEYIELARSQVRMHEDGLKLDKLSLALALNSNDEEAARSFAWTIFSETLSIHDFKYVESLYHKHNMDVAALINKAEKALLARLPRATSAANNSRSTRAIENLVEFYIYTHKIDKALALANQYELASDTIHDVAYASIKVRPKASFNLYRQLCLLYPQMGSTKDFQTCIDLLHEVDRELPREAKLSEKFDHLLAELADLFRYKEGFIVLLDEAFPSTRKT
jgi:uncharacterized Zn finger protein